MRIRSGSTEIVWLRLADGAEIPITRSADREETWPYWSPLAHKLVFQVSRGERQSDLVIWSPDAGEQPLAASELDQRWPAWSPTSAQLVYAFAAGREASGLIIADLETRQRAVVASAAHEQRFLRPAWSPDGRRLVTQRRTGPSGASELWLIDPAAPPQPLTRDPEWFDMKPRFTRDGTRIVFSRRAARGGPRDIVGIGATGGEVTAIVSDAAADDHSAWPSPTRDEIAFVSDRRGRPEIYLAGLDGARVRRISDFPGAAFAPRWSPDGEKLVVLVSEPDRPEPRLADRESLEHARVAVIDREGRVWFEAAGFMADWMPAWR